MDILPLFVHFKENKTGVLYHHKIFIAKGGSYYERNVCFFFQQRDMGSYKGCFTPASGIYYSSCRKIHGCKAVYQNKMAALVIIIIGAIVAKFSGNIVEGFSMLHLSVLTDIGNAVIGYMPYILASALILLACYVCDGLAGKALSKGNHTILAIVSKIAIYTVGAFMVLSELGIAKEIVNTAFILIIAALAIAFAISFGIGGRDFAEKILKKFYDTCGLEHEEKK